MPTSDRIQQLDAQRQEAMDRLASLVDRRQKYANYMRQQEQAEIDRLKGERGESQKRWGDAALMGAVLGAPFGAPILGAVAGGLLGGARAYGQRRKEGAGAGEALLGTLGNIQYGIPAIDTITSLAPAAAQAYGSHLSRTQQTARGGLTPQQAGQPGQTELYPGAKYFEPWKFDPPPKYRGSM